jgi:RNA polymerase-interacting CarD/CdnL/TRCF family regulator
MAPSSPKFERGDRLFLHSAGVATLVDFAGRDPAGKPRPLAPDEPPAFYVLKAGDSVACVPLERAPETLRPLVSRDDAEAMQAALWAQEPQPPPPNAKGLLERGRDVVHSGTPIEHARLLRELCDLTPPVTESLASGLRFLEGLVLGELSAVLGRPESELRAQLRDRFPAARDADGFKLHFK